MTTKDYCLRFKDKRIIAGYDCSNREYSNVNLNQNYQSFPTDIVISKSVTVDDRKLTNYGVKNGTAALQKLLDLTDTNFLQTRKESVSWNKSNKGYLNVDSEAELKEEKKDSNANINKSTFSLHITAYENSFNDKNEGKIGLTKKRQNAKLIVPDSVLSIQNPFEFPRQQQQTEIGEPEIAQFKASQKLLNPNEARASKSSSHHRNHFKTHVVHQSGDNHHHHHHHRNHHSAYNHGALDLIILQNKMYVPSMFHAAQETSLAMTAIRYKQNEVEYHKSLAMGRRASSSSSSQSYFNPPPSFPQNPTPTWLPLIRILPFTTPQMESSANSHAKDKKHHQQQHSNNNNNLTESISFTTEDDNVFLPPGISPLKLETNPFKHISHHHHHHSPNLSPTNTLSPALSHSDTLSPNDIHVPVDSLFHGTKKINKKTNKKRRAVVAGKAISLADLESKLIGTNGEKQG